MSNKTRRDVVVRLLLPVSAVAVAAVLVADLVLLRGAGGMGLGASGRGFLEVFPFGIKGEGAGGTFDTSCRVWI